MRMNLKKVIGLTALCLGLFTNAMPTRAGQVVPQEVYTGSGTGYQYAGGGLAGARYSADAKQSIGCSIYAYSVNPYVVCHAQTADSFLQCASYDARVLAAVQSITDSSRVYFQVKNGDSSCYNINISNDSRIIK